MIDLLAREYIIPIREGGGNGPWVPESHLSDLTFRKVVDDICDGHLSDLVAVLRFAPGRSPQDITSEIAEEVGRVLWCDAREPHWALKQWLDLFGVAYVDELDGQPDPDEARDLRVSRYLAAE
jgi:hypothetical protein